MKIDHGLEEQKSYMGGCLSILITIIMLVYSYGRVMALIRKKEVDILGAISEDAIGYTETFTAQSGFFVAAALTEFDSSTESIEEARYGELVIEHYGWQSNENGTESYSRPLNYHYCSDEELGLAASQSDAKVGLFPI